MSASGVLMGLSVFVLAPLLVRGLLGEEFGPTVQVLRVLSLMLPLAALSTALHVQWMLPLRLDRSFNVVILGAGVLNLVLALVLAPRYFQVGMAWAVVASELFVALGSIFILLRWRCSTPPRPSGPR
jgi:PST family polysaccharide transporter